MFRVGAGREITHDGTSMAAPTPEILSQKQEILRCRNDLFNVRQKARVGADTSCDVMRSFFQ